ncbi:aminotransferase class V-fold PLP-dependent enzyme [Streptomyces sp. NPDC021093]|uniref:aminotransferase class V-fold PLP-dependent enzyme n=1 Tax=Streptomyces sp. NPDC021093 TaxID=3365112 RepID=UPI0037B7D52F
MALDLARRRFVLGSGAVVGAAAAASAVASTGTARALPPSGPVSYTDRRGRIDWRAVRDEFRLDRSWTHLAAFLLTSHPRTVRQSIDHYRELMDRDPVWIWDHFDAESARVRTSLAGYTGGRPDEIALTPNTTVGIGLVYNSLNIRPGQEMFISEHDHPVHRCTVDLVARRCGAVVRDGKLYDTPAKASATEAMERLRAAIGPKTRTVGATWVHSSTGVKLPIPALAEVVAEANRGRAEEDRCFLVVDGLHGFGIEDADAARLGGDFFISGTHKWLFGPRGTGFVWGRPEAWKQLSPVISATYPKHDQNSPTGPADIAPGAYFAFEHTFSVPAAVDFHQKLGRRPVQERIHGLSTQVKEGLADIPGVTVHTPLNPAMSSGMTCFEIDGIAHQEVIDQLKARRIRASVAAYRVHYPRIGTGIVNSPEEVDHTLAAIRDIAERK